LPEAIRITNTNIFLLYNIIKNMKDKLWKAWKALATFYNLVDWQDIFWILSWRASLILQWVETNMNKDLDILTNEEWAKKISELLQEYSVQKIGNSENKKYKSIFATYEIDGIVVEVMGDFHYKTQENIWQAKYTKKDRIRNLHRNDLNLILIPLEDEIAEYHQLWRLTKVRQIQSALSIQNTSD